MLRAWSHYKKKRGENLKRTLFFNTYLHLCFPLLKIIWIWKPNHTTCIWSAAGVREDESIARIQNTWTQELGSWKWLSPQNGLAQPLGDCELRHTAFPFSLFSLPMSSAWAQPGLSSSPPASRPLPGGDKNSSPSPCLGKMDLGNQAADVHPHLEQGTHRARSFTTLLLTLISGLALSTPAPCRYTCWPQPPQPQCWWWEASQKSVKHVCYTKQLSSYWTLSAAGLYARIQIKYKDVQEFLISFQQHHNSECL